MFLKFATVLMTALTLSISAFAIPASQADFSKINLVGMRLLNEDNQDAFGYKIKPVKNLTKELIATLQKESASTVVSPVFELNESSAFKNIYVYIGKTEEGTFEFVEALQNRSGSFFVINMRIVDVSRLQLNLEHGPTDEVEHYTLVSTRGDLFQ